MFFWNSLAFSVIQRVLAIWSLVLLPFLTPACISMDMSLSKLQEIVNDSEAWHDAVHGITKSWTQLSNWTDSHLLKNFPQFVMIHIVKGFSIVNEANVFLEFSCLFYQQMFAIWSLVPLPFLNPACTSGSSQFMYYWSLSWRILSITLLACEMNAIVE